MIEPTLLSRKEPIKKYVGYVILDYQKIPIIAENVVADI